MPDRSSIDGDRPQDVGRRHRRQSGTPSPATARLLVEYQAAMRAELREVLAELRGTAQPAGLMDDQLPAPPVKRPSLGDRLRLWELAMKLGRELGTEIDAGPAAGELAGEAAPGPRRPPRLAAGDL